MTPLGPDDILSASELQAITGKARVYMQAGELAKRGIPFSFNGRAIRLQRVIALAHELMPERPPGGGVRLDLAKR